jgi:Flp pilus assembly protein TadG
MANQQRKLHVQPDSAAFAGRQARTTRWGDESGQGLVEFALLIPAVLLILVGIIEFGLIFSNVISLRQGTREAARQGAVAQFGTANAACMSSLAGAAGAANANTQNLLCLAKSQIGLGNENVRLKLLIDNPSLTSSGQSFAVSNGLVLCASYQLGSVSGRFGPIVNGRYVHTKTAYRIEQPSATLPAPTETSENDPSGGAWSWCTN